MNEVWIDGIKYVPELKAEYKGWIPHTGNKCPVHPKTEILVRFQDNSF